MGMKFANLQVRDLSLAESEKFLPDAIANQFSSRWTTIVQDDFDIGSIDMVGRKLSKKVDKTVLSVAYFDDDILVLTLFKNGKSIACHSSSNGYGHAKKMGNTLIFAQELELDDTGRDYLKWIFKCDDLPKKVDLLEKLLGIPLWIDAEMLEEDGVEEFNGNRDLSSVAQYVNEKKSSDKIKNRTKPKLISEFEGEINSQYTKPGYFVIQQPTNDNKYHSNIFKIYTPLPEGTLAPLLKDTTVHIGANSHLLTSGNLISIYENWNSSITYDEKGNLVEKSIFPDDVGSPLFLLPDGSVITSNYGLNQYRGICLYAMDGTKRWEIEVGILPVYPTFYNDCIYLQTNSEILKITQGGEIKARYEFTPCSHIHWNSFLFDEDGNIYYFCTVERESKRHAILFCFDDKLQNIAEIEFDDGSYEGLIDKERSKLYILLDEELVAVDIESFKVYERRKYEEWGKLRIIDSQGGVVTQKGSNTIEIFDENLNVISRHRLKGFIISSYKNSKGNVCIVTNCSTHDFTIEFKSQIRVYEIVYS